jgi:hypothetical protein
MTRTGPSRSARDGPRRAADRWYIVRGSRLPPREACHVRHTARTPPAPFAPRVTASRTGRNAAPLARRVSQYAAFKFRGDGQRTGARNWAAGHQAALPLSTRPHMNLAADALISCSCGGTLRLHCHIGKNRGPGSADPIMEQASVRWPTEGMEHRLRAAGSRLNTNPHSTPVRHAFLSTFAFADYLAARQWHKAVIATISSPGESPTGPASRALLDCR